MEGFVTCPDWLKDAYIRAVEGRCQLCHKKEELTPHRFIRGHKGGKYTVCKLGNKNNNIKMVCSDCHRKIHYGEFK